jgi:hypothetical protein
MLPGALKGGVAMRFVQTIEFRTNRIDEFNQLVDDWLASTEGSRIPTRGQLTRDRDRDSTYIQIVEFPSYEQAMENSNRADTTAFAEAMGKLCEGEPVFHNLDVLRDDEM